MKRYLTADRIIGLIFIIVGLLFIIESRRLAPLRMRGAVGDDTLPLVLGLIAILLGAFQAFSVEAPPTEMALPRGKPLLKVIGSFVVLIAYWALLPPLGYSIATFLCSTAMFRIFGSYRWQVCLLFSLILTSFLYFVFIHSLNMPFPPGVFGI